MSIQNSKACTSGKQLYIQTLFNYTPLVIGGIDKNKQLTIVKPTQTGINRNKYTFCILKLLEPLKNLKTSRVPQ
jgi:hypothetical protein